MHQDKDDGNEDSCNASTCCGDDTSDILSDAGSFLDYPAKVPATRQVRPLHASTTLPAAAPYMCMTRAAGNEANFTSNENSNNTSSSSSSNSIVNDTTSPSTTANPGCPDDHLVAAGRPACAKAAKRRAKVPKDKFWFFFANVSSLGTAPKNFLASRPEDVVAVVETRLRTTKFDDAATFLQAKGLGATLLTSTGVVGYHSWHYWWDDAATQAMPAISNASPGNWH